MIKASEAGGLVAVGPLAVVALGVLGSPLGMAGVPLEMLDVLFGVPLGKAGVPLGKADLSVVAAVSSP